MKKYIVKRIKDKIELNGQDYADAYIANIAFSGKDTAEAKKNVEASKLAMKTIEERLVFLKDLLKKEEK